MSYIETTSPNEAEGAVREMYQRQQDAWGYVPNYAKSFCHRPEVMARWGRLLAEIRRPLDDRTFELVTFAAAIELRHSPCSLVHGKNLLPFFSKDEICAIAEGRAVESLTAGETEMLRFSRKVARDAAAVAADDVQRLKDRGYSDADVFDIAVTAAGRAFFTKVLDAVGSLPDAPLGSIDGDLRAVLTVGRPIDKRDAEVINCVSN
jgi:hypothetical protein